MFEVQTTIPVAKDLIVSVIDFDLVSADDLIGETVIDLENRFLTKYRATVGLPKSYCTSGVCRWRDSLLPTQILAEFCEKHLEKVPIFQDEETVDIGDKTYTLAEFGEILAVDISRLISCRGGTGTRRLPGSGRVLHYPVLPG